MRHMVTPEQLAELLRGVNVAEVAKAANVSTKTVYRLRQYDPAGDWAPNFSTVRDLAAAVRQIKAAPAKRKPAKAAA